MSIVFSFLSPNLRTSQAANSVLPLIDGWGRGRKTCTIGHDPQLRSFHYALAILISLLLHISTYCDCNHLLHIEHDNHPSYLFSIIFVSIFCFLSPHSCLSFFFQSTIHKTSSCESLFLRLHNRKEYIWGYTYIYVCVCVCVCVDRDSSVGIATRYGLDDPEIKSR
jgi:hypothetical protein